MKRRVHFTLKVANDADGAQIRDSVIADLVGFGGSIFFQDIAPVYTTRSAPHVTTPNRQVVGRIRFTNVATSNLFFDKIEAKWTTGALKNKILAGSTATTHDCVHDDPVIADCSTQNFSQRVKV